MVGFLNAGGGRGGGIGNKLTVTAPANTSVTARLGERVKTGNSGSAGSVIFKNLNQGSWDISIANSEQTVTVPVAITTDYFTTIAFFTAYIAVTYPVGSTCTCSNGSTSYTAPDTGGSYTFYVPRTGTWVVSCTNGAGTVSKNVSITADGQRAAITLSYWDGTLYYNGDPYTDYTGGWASSTSDGGPASFLTNITWSFTNVTAYVYTKKLINVTNWNRLCFTGSLWGSYSFGLGNKQAWMSSANWLVRISGDGTKNDGSVDISKVTGNCYINVYTSSEGGSGGNLSRVWLE